MRIQRASLSLTNRASSDDKECTQIPTEAGFILAVGGGVGDGEGDGLSVGVNEGVLVGPSPLLLSPSGIKIEV